MQATYAVVFVLLGLLVLVSYAVFYPFDDRAIWAGLRDRRAFAVWCVTGSTSVVAFLAFSYELLNATTDGECIFPYTAFLSSAALYMPFASNMYFMATILLLAVTAVSAWLMVYCSAMLFGWNYCTWLLVVLAVHCTVVDLIFWGYTWWNQPIQAECSYEQVIAVAVECT
jgi:hypothetical protein